LHPWSFALADFNGDGNTDVIAEADYELSFMAGTGTGYFAPPVSASSANVEADQYLAADFNNDGSMDIVSRQISYCDDSIYFHFGNGDGTLDMPEGYWVGYPHGMATGDFNGDGFTDITINSMDSLLVLLNDGGGNFSAGAIASFSTYAFELLIVSDLNGDGTDDIATASKYLNTNKLKTFMGNGDGTFQAPASLSLPYQIDYTDVVAVKLTQSTYPDLIFTCENNFVQVYPASGDGTFNIGPKYPVGGRPWYMVSADFNGDAYPDIATANGYSENVSVLVGKPDGTLDAYIHEHYIGDFVSSLTTGDFNEDGLADLSASVSQLYDLDFFAMMYGDGTAPVCA
jgi:hypothetical protein